MTMFGHVMMVLVWVVIISIFFVMRKNDKRNGY